MPRYISKETKLTLLNLENQLTNRIDAFLSKKARHNQILEEIANSDKKDHLDLFSVYFPKIAPLLERDPCSKAFHDEVKRLKQTFESPQNVDFKSLKRLYQEEIDSLTTDNLLFSLAYQELRNINKGVIVYVKKE